MHKDFDQWNKLKQSVHARQDGSGVFFKEREVWWCMLGINIGYEQDGKGSMSQRPVLILKKFNRSVFIGVPLSSKPKDNPHYLNLIQPVGRSRSVIISQIRLLDIRRLMKKAYTMPTRDYQRIKKAVSGFFL